VGQGSCVRVERQDNRSFPLEKDDYERIPRTRAPLFRVILVFSAPPGGKRARSVSSFVASEGNWKRTFLPGIHLCLPISDAVPPRDLLALCEQVLDGLLAVVDLLLLLFERLVVDEFATLAGLTTELCGVDESEGSGWEGS
jgi:hypothetical protein